jgi:translation initiation factor IF-3
MIRVPRVRVVDPDGEPLGILSTSDALQKANEAELDLVEVAPSADPPVCRIMDYGKFKYEKSKKEKEAKKKQHQVHLKEVKFHPKTEEHDYTFKMEHARKFLLNGDRVKATMVYRGREITHIDIGRKVLEKLEEDLKDIATGEQQFRMEGRNMVSTYLPDRAKIKTYERKVQQERKREEKEAAEKDSEKASKVQNDG